MTRIAPTRAVANWVTTHSKRFGAQMPDAVALAHAVGEQRAGRAVGLRPTARA